MTQENPPQRSWLDLAYKIWNDPTTHKILLWFALAVAAYFGKGKLDYLGQKAVENGAVIQDTHAEVVKATSPDAAKVNAAQTAAENAAEQVSPAAQMPLINTPGKTDIQNK